LDNLAKAKAKILLDEYCIKNPAELNLIDIAAGENLIIEEAPLNGHLGRNIFSTDFGIIKISSSVKEEGQKRFIIAHEMGHFFIQKNNVKGCSLIDMLGFKSNQSIERSSNDFASELLMPAEWINSFTKKEKPGIKLLKSAAEYFRVSISAAALRLAELGSYPMAVIMSTNEVVKWSNINKLFSFNWIPNGYKVNNNSFASDIFKQFKEVKNNKDNCSDVEINCGLLDCNEVLADAWFWEDRNYKKDYYMFEQNIPMPNYNSVLTILWEK